MKRPARPAQARRFGLALFAIVAAAVFGLIASSAKFDAGDAAAFGARPITPAGSLVMDAATRQPAVGALPVSFVRSPDRTGPDGRGRYLLAVNSGFGIQFNSATNRGQQSLAVVDLNARPAPAVVQNVYFPTPQSANVGAVFAPRAAEDGSFALYVSGGFENKIWMFRLRPGAATPLSPTSNGPDTKVDAPFLDVSAFASSAPHPRYNTDRAPVYPSGLAISDDGDMLFVANNLGDSLGIISEPGGARRLERIELAGQKAGEGAEHFVYPYAVVALPYEQVRVTSKQVGVSGTSVFSGRGFSSKVYVSCWNDASVAVIDFAGGARRVSYIAVERHPTAMTLSADASRLYVANSNADSVSVIDTASDKEVERINVRLAESAPIGSSPEGLALSADERTLYVANAHSNSVAVVGLSDGARGATAARVDDARGTTRDGDARNRSNVRGFIPTGYYASAVAFAGGSIFVGNGKGTGFENSSLVSNTTGRAPNIPNDRFPAGTGRGGGQGGEYSIPLVAGNISRIAEPNERELARYTQQVMRNDGLLGPERRSPFGGKSPFKHIIYVIKENRTYDQVFGDLERSGDGTRADGDAALAIFGAGEAARAPGGAAQNVSPNHHALALRFGLFDRFFVNSEASPDGHNWATAAFSTDYLDKAYRLNYSSRGRSYDFEGFNRMPNIWPQAGAPPLFRASADAAEITEYTRRFVPYLRGARDVTEPETLYLWDAAARAGLSYRNYGEYISTLSEADVASIKENRSKPYPDISQTVSAFATKKSLEGHFSQSYRNFGMLTPDSMTVASYRAAKSGGGSAEPLVGLASDGTRARDSYSRFAVWLEEFRAFVAEREAGRPDSMPNLSIVRLPNDHTNGLSANRPTPQFYVADNDYALGRLVEAVSNSPFWKDTAIFVVEDDAQDGPDHVDCHRSVALVISAYNRPGALVHEFHSTVSLIRTMELLLGFGPMNQLDASATPIDIFKSEPDLRPYKAALPDIALDNLVVPRPSDAESIYWSRLTDEQDMTHADMADPRALNEAIWFSVRGPRSPMPEAARLPAFDALKLGINAEAEDDERMEGRDGRRAGFDVDERRIDKNEVASRASRSRQRRNR